MITLDLRPALALTDEQFAQICQNNRDLRFERTAQGELVILAPTGGETGRTNVELAADLVLWNRRDRLGVVFDSSTGFKLPNGSTRSPDVAWVRLERWEALTPDQQRRFVPLCPDFAIELKSPSDELADLQAKMQEYLENGLQLGWLIDPEQQRVDIYRPHHAPESLSNPKTLSDEALLPGFVLDLSEIFC
ncbi:Uma2 family endonuclease [Nodosilinea sp. P-1105]|uniref:Uma2 family endonuclease n=1 Tax=Nodosilinea sp. P-1105 TaxID=2546229 RepID=UPI00146DAF43|nr:Uma2 family endonuclease [Nodosilinea sp. P-1105]NMF86674.1 Uma2 family endonuclease [Nodosilinea sp. P-1105]